MFSFWPFQSFICFFQVNMFLFQNFIVQFMLNVLYVFSVHFHFLLILWSVFFEVFILCPGLHNSFVSHASPKFNASFVAFLTCLTVSHPLILNTRLLSNALLNFYLLVCPHYSSANSCVGNCSTYLIFLIKMI